MRRGSFESPAKVFEQLEKLQSGELDGIEIKVVTAVDSPTPMDTVVSGLPANSPQSAFSGVV